jgi:cell wall-associated NlpC family hydrolase
MAKAQYPLDGKLGKQYRITSDFGWRTHPIQKIKKHHNGVDLWGAAEPLYIESWYDGVVTFAGTSKQKLASGAVGGLGWYVEIRSKVNGKYYVSRYGHMVPNSLKVKKGQKVEAGTVLGKMGTSGASTGKHLHFEICEGKVYRWDLKGKGFINPMLFIKSVIQQEKIIAEGKLATSETAPVAEAPISHEEAGAKLIEAEKVAVAPVVPAPVTVASSVELIAREVLAGKWGSGATRTKKLTNAGHNPKAVQDMVNQILSGKVPAKAKAPVVNPAPAKATVPAPAPTTASVSELHPALRTEDITSGTVEAVLAVAKYYVDKKYVEGPKKNTVFGKFMNLNYAPWCASFVSYVFNKAGAGHIVRGTQTKNGFVGCSAGIRGLKKKGFKTVKLAEALPGDIIFFDWQNDNDPDHVGIVLKSHPKKKIVTCYEGNTSNGKGGSQSNGGGVYKRDRRYSLVHVVIRPVFKVTSTPKATTIEPTA